MMTDKAMTQDEFQGMDLALRIEQLLADFTTCLAAETTALKAKDRMLSQKYSQEKQRLLMRYKDIRAELEKDPKELDLLDPTVKAYLKKTVQQFDQALRQNAAVINGGKSAVGRLITRILDKARANMAARNPGYNARGQMAGAHTAQGRASIQVNETL